MQRLTSATLAWLVGIALLLGAAPADAARLATSRGPVVVRKDAHEHDGDRETDPDREALTEETEGARGEARSHHEAPLAVVGEDLARLLAEACARVGAVARLEGVLPSTSRGRPPSRGPPRG